MKDKFLKYLQKYSYAYGVQALCTVLVFFLVGSLWTFLQIDASFFYHTTQPTHHNLFGFAGASCAALLVYLFGAASYLFVAGLCYSLLFAFKVIDVKDELDRVVGILLFVLSSAVLCSLYEVGVDAFAYHGGIVGNRIVTYGLYHFDTLTQFALAYFFVTIAVVLMVRFSHLMVVHHMLWAGQAVMHYVMQTDHMPARMVRAIGFGLAQLLYSVAWIIRWCKKLLDGSLIKESGMSVMQFEQDEPIDDHVTEILQDLFAGQRDDQHKEHELSLGQQIVHDVDDCSYAFEEDKPEEGVLDQIQTSVGFAQEVEQDSKSVRYQLPDTVVMSAQGNLSSEIMTKDDQLKLDEQSAVLEEKLAQFGIQGKVVRVNPGPVITLFEYKPDSHIKLSKILALEDDLAMALQALSIRILAPIPGTNVVGFEVSNKSRNSVLLQDIFARDTWRYFSGNLPLVLGEDTFGADIIVDLANMPHLLIAGSTGSGKSVALNCMLVSLLCAKTPEDVQLIIIDPKRLEFAAYEDIAHLLFPIVTDPKRAIPVLKWVVKTMEDRYESMAQHGVRNIFDYHDLLTRQPELDSMPFIVVIIDELADLMMTAGKDAEGLIARIAQMSRAAGIHMIVATQRPSVDVITGLIKVNFPNRISFKVTSKVDSRTILDEMGAERLLGKGDMLFVDSKNPEMKRVHGAYVSDEQIRYLVCHIHEQQKVNYLDLTDFLTSDSDGTVLEADEKLYQEVVSMLKDMDEVSISMIQRRFRIGYNRSARIIEALEAQGLVMSADGGKMRRVVKE